MCSHELVKWQLDLEMMLTKLIMSMDTALME